MANFKYGSPRHMSVVSRDNSLYDLGSGQESDIYSEYVKNLQKSSVSGKSIYEEISSILGNSKSKFSSVDEVVEDMAKRTGLRKMQEMNSKVSQAHEHVRVEIFEKMPELKTFIDNFVEDRPGTSVEAVVHEIMRMDSVRKQVLDKEDVSDDLKRYISYKISEKSSHYPSIEIDINFGKVDKTNDVVEDNPLGFCEPNR